MSIKAEDLRSQQRERSWGVRNESIPSLFSASRPLPTRRQGSATGKPLAPASWERGSQSARARFGERGWGVGGGRRKPEENSTRGVDEPDRQGSKGAVRR